jgi:hypothetical protein
VVAHFSRRVLLSSCLSPRRPIAKMTSRPRSRCGVVGWGGGGVGGVGWPRASLRRAFEVSSRFSRQVLVHRTHFPLVGPSGHKSCAKSAAGGFLSSSCLRGAAALARFFCLLFAGNRSGPVPTSWPRVLTLAPSRSGSARQEVLRESLHSKPRRRGGTRQEAPALLQRRFKKPGRTISRGTERRRDDVVASSNSPQTHKARGA